jgi:hypothetical protein
LDSTTHESSDSEAFILSIFYFAFCELLMAYFSAEKLCDLLTKCPIQKE